MEKIGLILLEKYDLWGLVLLYIIVELFKRFKKRFSYIEKRGIKSERLAEQMEAVEDYKEDLFYSLKQNFEDWHVSNNETMDERSADDHYKTCRLLILMAEKKFVSWIKKDKIANMEEVTYEHYAQEKVNALLKFGDEFFKDLYYSANYPTEKQLEKTKPLLHSKLEKTMFDAFNKVREIALRYKKDYGKLD